MELMGTILGIVLALGAIGAWLLTAGRTMERNAETKKDVDAIGKKVGTVEQKLQCQIDAQRVKHDSLSREVSEIKATTTSTHALVEQLVRMHLEDSKA